MTGIGGIQQYCRTLKRALEELGQEVIVPTTLLSMLHEFWTADRVILTHRNYLRILHFCKGYNAILLLHGIDAEAPLTWLERLALKRISTIWVISEWTNGLAKKFGKPTEVLYLCTS